MTKDIVKALATWWALLRYRKTVGSFFEEKLTDAEELNRYSVLFFDHDLVVFIRDKVLGKITWLNAGLWIFNAIWLAFVFGTGSFNPALSTRECIALTGSVLVLFVASAIIGLWWPRHEQQKLGAVRSIEWKRLVASVGYYRAVAKNDPNEPPPAKPNDLLPTDALGDNGPFGPNGRMTFSLLFAPLVATGAMVGVLLIQMNMLGVTGKMGYFAGLFQGTVMGVAFFLALALNKLLTKKGVSAGREIGTIVATLFADGFAKPGLNLFIVGVEEEESKEYANTIKTTAKDVLEGTEKTVHHYSDVIFSGACAMVGIMIAGQYAYLTLPVCAGYLIFGILLPHMLPRKEGKYDMWKEFVADVGFVLLLIFFVMQIVNAISLESGGTKATPMRLFNRLASECNNALVADIWRGLILVVIAGIVFLLTKPKEKEIKTVPAWIGNRVNGGAKVTAFLVLFGAGMRVVFNDPRIPYIGNGDGALSGEIPNAIRWLDSPQQAVYDMSSREFYYRHYGTTEPPVSGPPTPVPLPPPRDTSGCIQTTDPNNPRWCPPGAH